MTREELMALRRGDVVQWLDDAELGLVTAVNERGVFVRWEDNTAGEGPYKTDVDASKMTLYSKVIA